LDESGIQQYFVIPTKPEDGTQLNDCTKDALKKIKEYGRLKEIKIRTPSSSYTSPI
jgi:hypothetical protein